jgi:hypothetical protein
VVAYLAATGALGWMFVWYGVGSLLLLTWALRPNFARLARGEERLAGLRAKRRGLSASRNE